MPLVIYLFALVTFSLGLAQFLPIGLTNIVAQGLGVSIEQAGTTVTWYALGATIAAPLLAALTAGWTRKRTILLTLLAFTFSSLLAALADTLTLLMSARFVAGMAHGLLFAVASSTAIALAGQARAGRALSVILGGFTLAMAVGVPLSTWLAGVLSWRAALGLIAAAGVLAWIGLWAGMKEPPPQTHAHANSVRHALRAIFQPILLWPTLVTVLGFAGSYAVYTYIAPLLTQVTHISEQRVPVFMLLYGVLAVAGNVLGGKLTDRLGVDKACAWMIGGIGVAALGISILAHSVWAMGTLTALLGLFTTASIPALQARLIGTARQHAPHAQGVAAGLNIAGFSLGITLGSALGNVTIGSLGLVWTGAVGAVMAGLGLMVLWAQMAGKASASAGND